MVRNIPNCYEDDIEKIVFNSDDIGSLFAISDNDLRVYESDMFINETEIDEEVEVTQCDDTSNVKKNYDGFKKRGAILKERFKKVISKLHSIQLQIICKCSSQEINNIIQLQENRSTNNIKPTLFKHQKRPNQSLESSLCDEVLGDKEVVGILESQIKIINKNYDSEATESDSESDIMNEISDDGQVYNYPIEESISWKWYHNRANIAYYLTWLTNVTSDIELKIHLYNDVYNQCSSYPCIQDRDEESCRRCLPYELKTRRKMLVQSPFNDLAEIYNNGNKTILNHRDPCNCNDIDSCSTCVSLKCCLNGHSNHLMDTIHPVLSSYNDIQHTLLNNTLRNLSFQQKQKKKSILVTNLSKKVPDDTSHQNYQQKVGLIENNQLKKFNKNQRQKLKIKRLRKHKINKMGHKYNSQQSNKNNCNDNDVDDMYEKKKYNYGPDYNTKHKYDIDNIIMPHSFATTIKIEMMKYKEIVTPKWRIVEEFNVDPVTFSIIIPEPEIIEDLDDKKRYAHHKACEIEEQSKLKSMKKQLKRTYKNSN